MAKAKVESVYDVVKPVPVNDNLIGSIFGSTALPSLYIVKTVAD